MIGKTLEKNEVKTIQVAISSYWAECNLISIGSRPHDFEKPIHEQALPELELAREPLARLGIDPLHLQQILHNSRPDEMTDPIGSRLYGFRENLLVSQGIIARQ